MNEVLRKDEPNQCYWHWCAACKLEHPLPFSWSFDGNELRPTFSPSFLQRFGRDRLCHYFIRDGKISYCADSKHELARVTVVLAPMPEEQ